MTLYQAPVRHSLFALEAATGTKGRGRDASTELAESILTEAGRFAERELHPLNQVGDREGCRWGPDGVVETPKGFRQAYSRFVEQGWPTLTASEEFGGQGLPGAIGAAVQEYWIGANMGFAQYGILTHSAVLTLSLAGSPDQKRLYLPRMVAGSWSGAMCLTEAQSGSDLGLIETRAVRRADGSYALTGTKIFISAGEHDLTENIIHLVLARLDAAPAGVGGLSLFIVPKMLIDQNGAVVGRNAVSCTSVEHKMGIRASATCVMTFEEATGHLVGEENKGLASMFLMMNQTRLTTGLQGVAMAEVSYQNALAYARDRRQGRRAGRDATAAAAADPIIVHPDVRRMLMDMKAFIEGARALVYWTVALGDRARLDPDLSERRSAEAIVALMTPVVKAYLTDMGLLRTIDAQQVFGGHGYICDQGMDQFVRDARISTIYEGTNGIQAMDLISRKFIRDKGQALYSYLALVRLDLAALPEHGGDRWFGVQMEDALCDMEQAAGHLQQAETSEHDLGAVAHDFLHLLGTVSLGHMWAKLITHADRMRLAEPANARFFETRLSIARYFGDRWLPETRSRKARIISGGSATMAIEPNEF